MQSRDNRMWLECSSHDLRLVRRSRHSVAEPTSKLRLRKERKLKDLGFARKRVESYSLKGRSFCPRLCTCHSAASATCGVDGVESLDTGDLVGGSGHKVR